MNSEKSDVQEVLVDVPKYDKDGNPISLDSLSSGGARKADGSLIAQYRNPRLPKSANEHEVDREFNEFARHNSHTLRRRKEEAEERRRKKSAERDAQLVLDNVVKPLVQQVVIPLAQQVVIPLVTELWNTRVLPEGKRLVQCWLRPKMSRPQVPRASGDTLEVADEIANPLATSLQITDYTTEISTAQKCREDTSLAAVMRIDEFQNRRAA